MSNADPVCSISPPDLPANRRLSVFSLDPSADVQLDTASISRSVISIPWEKLKPGPVGEYIEVVDVDPSSGCLYEAIDMDHHFLLGQDGYPPSSGNPQFHQQMVYAVAMKTIKNFEEVLGREVMWSERDRDEEGKPLKAEEQRYVPRLRIYPHALREQNAYYSPVKKSLLFGYFNAPTTDPRDELPGGMVFTCMSHDIIAHETVHAILDGIHPRLLNPSNEDMLAFHEGFADIVAIFQHFTLPGLLLDQIQRTRGYLQQNSLLAQLAVQFARSTNQGGALRNALGQFGKDGRRQTPDPATLASTLEPHDRGAILVAAVFDAFLRIYESRVADLRRISTGGTGILPDGDIHPDLARRFAREAAHSAQRVLNICIRAIDYLPPVDITYGDYLRALITADADFYPADPNRYRLAFIESFRERGILPIDVRALAEDSLRWRQPDAQSCALLCSLLPPAAVLRTMTYAYDAPQALLDAFGENVETENSDAWHEFARKFLDFDLASESLLQAAWLNQGASQTQSPSNGRSRENRYKLERIFARFLHSWITAKARSNLDPEMIEVAEKNLGLDFPGLVTKKTVRLEVHAIRPTIRLRPNGNTKVELLVVLTQRYRRKLDKSKSDTEELRRDELQFKFRGGCTLIIDPDAGIIRYAISKNICSQSRLQRNERFYRGEIERFGDAAIERYGLVPDAEAMQRIMEPFALAHGGESEMGCY